MAKNSIMKPQDILVLLEIVTLRKESWTQAQIAKELMISPSEVSGALDRCVVSGLINASKDRVNRQALKEFLINGIKYVFPAQIGTKTRGIATAHSASPIKEFISEGEEAFVWSYYKGTKRGLSIEPLYKTVPKIIESNLALYELLVIIDTLRIGRVREVEIAINELDKRLSDV